MSRLIRSILTCYTASSLVCLAQTNTLAQAEQLGLKGEFKEAGALLRRAMESKALPVAERKRLEFELDRLERIKKDFPYTKESLFADLKKAVKDLTVDEFERWVEEGRFDSREIDGKRYFMTSSVSNLFWRYPELNLRRVAPKETAPLEKLRLQSCRTIKQTAINEHKPYVLPKRFNVTMTVAAKPTSAPAGEMIKAWLPIPRRFPFQQDFELVSTSSKARHIDNEDSAIRCVYLEQPTKAGNPSEFKI